MPAFPVVSSDNSGLSDSTGPGTKYDCLVQARQGQIGFHMVFPKPSGSSDRCCSRILRTNFSLGLSPICVRNVASLEMDILPICFLICSRAHRAVAIVRSENSRLDLVSFTKARSQS